MMKLKWLILPLAILSLVACGGGGGGGGSDNSTNPVDPGPIVSAFVSSSENALTTALKAIAGITSSQAQQITTAATNQLRIDSLLDSSDASQVLPSLLEGTMAGIGSLNLSDEELINTLIEQSVSTMMSLVGEDANSRQQRSAERTAEELQSLLEVLVETALTNLEQTKLPDASLGKAVGKVVVAVVANLDKAKVQTSDVSNTVDKVVGKSMAGLQQLPDVALESAVDEITENAIEGAKTLKQTKTDLNLGESVGKVVSAVVSNLDKAKVQAVKVSSAVEKIIKQSIESLAGLDQGEVTNSVKKITDGAIQGAGNLAARNQDVKSNLGSTVSTVAKSATEGLASLTSDDALLAALQQEVESTLEESVGVVVILLVVDKTDLDNSVSEGLSQGSASLTQACAFGGRKYLSGDSVPVFPAQSVQFGQSCKTENRICDQGTLSGGAYYDTCSVGDPAECSFDGKTVSHGQSVTAYFTSGVEFGDNCLSENRECFNGTLKGSYVHPSCEVAEAAACEFNGQAVSHGGFVTAYLEAEAESCVSELRTCDDGTLNGSYEFESCTTISTEPKEGIFCGAPADVSCQAADVARFGEVKFGK